MITGPAERACAAAAAILLFVACALAAVRAGTPERTPFEVARSAEAGRSGVPPAGRPLERELGQAGIRLPPGTDVYAVRLGQGGRPAPDATFQAGRGGAAADFWSASSIKVLAAVGALEFAATLGFSGQAAVTYDSGITGTLREIYDAAIRDSSNDDYDLLVQIAGLDWLNDEFLTAENGFPVTVIEQSFAGYDLRWSPGMTFTEDDRSTYLPPREATGDHGCPEGNCSNLFELAESVRRILVHDEIPEAQRFAVDRTDLSGLRSALLGADGFFNRGAATALGPATRVYSKPGWVPGLDCVDVAFIEGAGDRFLLAVTTPDLQDGGECPSLSTVAYAVLRVLRRG